MVRRESTNRSAAEHSPTHSTLFKSTSRRKGVYTYSLEATPPPGDWFGDLLLTHTKAEASQDALAGRLAQRWNSHEAMLEALNA